MPPANGNIVDSSAIDRARMPTAIPPNTQEIRDAGPASCAANMGDRSQPDPMIPLTAMKRRPCLPASRRMSFGRSGCTLVFSGVTTLMALPSLGRLVWHSGSEGSTRAPREQQGNPRSGRNGAALAKLRKSGQSRRAGRIDRDACSLDGKEIRAGERVLAHDHRLAAGLEHRADHGKPVVRLVVEEAVRDTPRLALPRPHERGSVVGGVAQDRAKSGGSAARRNARGNEVVSPLQRPGALGLYRVQPWRARQYPQGDGLGA